MDRKATAHWQGNLKEGNGTVRTESGALASVPYSFDMRFGNRPGTNPEELIAAALSACFSMALSAELQKHQLVCESLEVGATITLDKSTGGWSIPRAHLDVTAKVPGASAAQFDEAVKTTQANCPVAKLLNAEITVSSQMQSRLEPSLQETG